MTSKKPSKRINPDTTAKSPAPQVSELLAMLESLADALENKADQVLDSGDTESQEIRSKVLIDIAEAIKERFMP